MLLFIDGFEHYTTLSQKGWNASAAVGINTANPRTGARYVNLTQLLSNLLYLLPGGVVSTFILGTGFHIASSAGANRLMYFRRSGSIQASIFHDPTNRQLQIVDSTGAVVASSGIDSIAYGVWNYVEVKLVAANAGSMEVRLNGVTVMSVSGDFQLAATSGVDEFAFGANSSSNNSTGIRSFDDIYVCDGSGSVNNDFLGDCKVETIYPTGAGNSTQMTPSAGSNWQCVDDAQPNDDTDYVSEATAGEKDLYALGDLASTAGTVKGIHIHNRWRKDDAGSRTARRVIRTNSTDYEGADVAMADGYVTTREIIETNPNTSAAWTIAEINALQAGQKLQA